MMNEFRFWGAATVGTKGQVVIPATAREKLAIHEGDKVLMVSPPSSDAIFIVKPEILKQYVGQTQATLEEILNADEAESEGGQS